MSSFYKRFMLGECENVWNEIYHLGSKAFDVDRFEDVSAVLKETMQRVKFNIDTIYERLVDMNYKFLESLEPARTSPDKSIEKTLIDIEEKISSFGHMPLALKELYLTVGSVNFIWDYENDPGRMWFEYADPMYIISPRYLLEEIGDDWKARMDEEISEGYVASPYLIMAPDYFHKDDISGGSPYSIEVTKEPSIDAKILGCENDITLIGYLRKCFEWGGFPRVTVNNIDYESTISRLTDGLKQI